MATSWGGAFHGSWEAAVKWAVGRAIALAVTKIGPSIAGLVPLRAFRAERVILGKSFAKLARASYDTERYTSLTGCRFEPLAAWSIT